MTKCDIGGGVKNIYLRSDILLERPLTHKPQIMCLKTSQTYKQNTEYFRNIEISLILHFIHNFLTDSDRSEVPCIKTPTVFRLERLACINYSCFPIKVVRIRIMPTERGMKVWSMISMMQQISQTEHPPLILSFHKLVYPRSLELELCNGGIQCFYKCSLS